MTVKHLFIGYGYRPWLAWLWLAGAVFLSLLLALLAGHMQDGRTHRPFAERPAQHIGEVLRPCSEGEQFGLGFHMTIPLPNNLAVGSCEINTAHIPGELFALGGLLLQCLAWFAASIAVASYTGLIKND